VFNACRTAAFMRRAISSGGRESSGMSESPDGPNAGPAKAMAELLARVFSGGRFGLRHMKHGERGAALSAVAAIDRALKNLLLANLANDEWSEKMLFGPTSPLGSVVAKAHLVFMMGLVDKQMRNDLLALAIIRNRFAHVEEAETFKDKIICAEVGKLKAFDAKEAISKLPEITNDPDLLRQFKEQLTDGFVFEHNIHAILRILQDSVKRNPAQSPPHSDASPGKPA
jgi:DNA-binding MltR family transcriptional regulator